MRNKEVIERCLILISLCISCKLFWGDIWTIIYGTIFIGGIIYAIKLSIIDNIIAKIKTKLDKEKL